MKKSKSIVAGLYLGCAAVSCAITPAQAGPFFQGLGDLPGGAFLSLGLGVSADGSVAVGYSAGASGDEAFRWTSGGGMVGLGDLPGGSFDSQAHSTSADGSVVVGFGKSG